MLCTVIWDVQEGSPCGRGCLAPLQEGCKHKSLAMRRHLGPWIWASRSWDAELKQLAEPFLRRPATSEKTPETVHRCSSSIRWAGRGGKRRPWRDAAVWGKQNKCTNSFLLGAVRKTPGGELISAAVLLPDTSLISWCHLGWGLPREQLCYKNIKAVIADSNNASKGK